MNLQFRFVYFCINIDYRGIMILHELSQCDSSNSLCVWFSHWLQGYRDSSWVVSKWFFNFALCDLVFSLYDFVFVSWFIMSCLYVILQLHFVCGFVFTLVTWDIIILQIFSSAEGGMKQISYKGDIVIGDAKIGMIFRGDKSNNSARGCFERGICWGGFLAGNQLYDCFTHRWGWCQKPCQKISIDVFIHKQRHLSIDMKTKIVQHVPRINISIWHKTCDMRHVTCNMWHVT